MTAIIGIDLGTTYSAVARLDGTGRAVIVHNSDGENITPSVVQFENATSQPIVGEDARKMLGLDNENTFGRFKREMGTEPPYENCAIPHTPTSLSAILLAHLKSETEEAIGPIGDVVVTVPANFANEAREATLSAARQAGLDVKFIINEPTAAALYYAYQSEQDLAGIYAVYDLGGGTFDVTIVRVDGNDIEVLSSEGVNRLGGDDFDKKLFELVAAKYQDLTGGTLALREYPPHEQEQDKRSLSRRPKVTISVVGDAGRTNIELIRDDFEAAISSYVAQMEMLCESAMEEAGVTAGDIREVILAGGSTRTPIVQQSVIKTFGKEPVVFGNPDEVVALGAAIYAAYRADGANLNSVQKASISKVKVQEITNKHYGVIAVGFNANRQSHELGNSIIITRNSKIPCTSEKPFYTVADDQTEVHCQITEANSPETDPKFVKVIWEGDLSLPSERPAGQEILVAFSYTANQTMACAFTDVATGRKTDVEIAIDSGSGTEELDLDRFTVE
jgi:molecular chaperone DnaK